MRGVALKVTLLGWAKHDFNRYLVYELLSGGDCFQRLQKSLELRFPMVSLDLGSA